MPNGDFFPKIDLTPEERERNMNIFLKVVEAILVPVFIGILLGYGNWITWLCGIIWEVGEVISLFYDPEALLISLIWDGISSN